VYWSVKKGIKELIPRALLTRDLGRGSGQRILLTFDDGPDPAVTPAVLDLLETFSARAVFFVVGRKAAESPETLRRIRAQGHLVGNHSFQHRRPPVRGYLRDLLRCQEVVRSHLGEAPALYRPPGGYLSPTTLAVPWLLGLRTINWTLDVRDHACRTRQQALVAARSLERMIQPGHIVLLHDDNVRVLDILEYVLPRLQSRGFDLGSAAALV
jgi:peptidoglycan-N-acetylglucosamine deacetylase